MRRLFFVAVMFALAACVPAAPPANTAKFLIFFEGWSASLENGGKDTVKDAVAYAAQHPNSTVYVSGFADPEGSPQANKDISRTRAQVVADALVASGISRQKIEMRAVGATQYVDNSLESRRVEIAIPGN